MTSNSDDLDTADIATRVHNTRPHQAKVYSPIFRHGQTGNVEDLHNGAPDDIKFFNSGRDANQPLSKHHSQGHTNNNSNKHRKEKVPVEEVITQHHLEEETTVQTAEKVFKKVAKKLAGIVERDEQVKVVAGLLLRLRQQYALDDAVLSEVLRWGLLQLLLTSSEKIFKFEHLAEEALNCMLPLVRAPDLRARATTCLVKAGAITFSMTSIRLFHKSNANIRVLALELLASLVDFVVGCHARGARDVGSSLGKFVAKNYVVHHLLLHGAASSFPSLLSLAIQTNSDLSVQRTLRCLTFVLTETPPDLSVTVAMSNRWGLLRDLLHCIRAGGSAGVKVQAAVLLTGLLASSAVVAEKLVDMQGWDDLSTALVSPALDFSSASSSLFCAAIIISCHHLLLDIIYFMVCVIDRIQSPTVLWTVLTVLCVVSCRVRHARSVAGEVDGHYEANADATRLQKSDHSAAVVEPKVCLHQFRAERG